jgi:hypothetical protein
LPINMFTLKDLWGLKYMVVYSLLIIGLFAYAGATGWKIFGSNTEKWEADGPGNHSHSSRNSYSRGSHFYHK